MRNPYTGLVKEVLSASHLGCQSSSRLRTLTVNLTGLLRGETFRREERSNKSGQHVAGVGIRLFRRGAHVRGSSRSGGVEWLVLGS